MKTLQSITLTLPEELKTRVMMKKMTLLLFALILATMASAQIREGGAIFPFKVSFNKGTELTLNGTGMNEGMMKDLYAGGLYLKKRSHDAMGIASAIEDMAIKIKVISKQVTRRKMIAAMYEGFDKATYGNTAPIQFKINKYVTFFSQPIEKGDEFDIVYVEGVGSKCFKNGRELGTVAGEDFKFALFKIWLGEKPVSKPLKTGMLGM